MEIVDRVFKIRCGASIGTCFSLDVDERQYVVTAKHVIPNVAGRTTIGIFHNGDWKSLEIEVVGHSDVDVSVVAAQKLLTHKEMQLEAAAGGFHVGQDVFFAGFPLGMTSQNIDSVFPAPLFKKAIISGSAGAGPKFPFFLDGHNNPGFSGGPVYLKIPGKQSYVVSMIVSAFRYYYDPIYGVDKTQTEFLVQQNSGIMLAYNIKNALDLIRSNPIGFKLD